MALLKTLEPSLQRELAPGLARKLSFYDPAAALSFFLSSDYGAPSERSTVTFLMQTFLEKEPLELSKLLRDAQSSPQKDAAAAYLSNRLASSDYEAATSWAESIKDDKIKRQALAEIQQIRNAKNPTALDSLFNTGE